MIYFFATHAYAISYSLMKRPTFGNAECTHRPIRMVLVNAVVNVLSFRVSYIFVSPASKVAGLNFLF